MNLNKVLVVLLLVFLAACKEPFNPDIPAKQASYLVVEGFIEAGSKPTVIRLSRTTGWNDSVYFKAENAAAVSVEGEDNSSFVLPASGGGLYSAQLNINKAVKYRLHIKTTNGEEFFSDFVKVKITPAIDSINWKLDDQGLQIYANTHDPLDSTRYYRWNYDETWEIHSTFYAIYEFKDGAVVPRDQSVNIFYCWKYASSATILVGSSAKLKSDIIYEYPLLQIPKHSEKTAVRYSVLVRQYALSKEAFEFFQLMRKNTESMGTIFDPQPSLLASNIYNVNGQKNVIGYMYAATEEEKRIFINRNELPADWRFDLYCETMEVLNHPDSIKAYFPGLWPYDAKRMGPFITHWYSASPRCVDCRERGGFNVKPSYW